MIEQEPTLPRADRLIHQISEAITSDELRPGARLTEQELLGRFDTTRGPLREALRRLEERHLLVRLQYCGVRVVEFSQDAIAELYEIRELLEGLACRRAAQRITPGEIAELRMELRADLGRLAALRSGEAPQPAAIRDFHLRLAEIAGSGELLKLLSGEVWKLLRANYRRYAASPELMLKGNRDHERILDALEERDGELAEMLMRRHIAVSCANLEQALGERLRQAAAG